MSMWYFVFNVTCCSKKNNLDIFLKIYILQTQARPGTALQAAL